MESYGRGWLIGKGFEDNRLSSVETWSFNSEGQLMERRQFSSNGAFIELSVVERGQQNLSSRGQLTRRTGERVQIQHSLRKIDENHIEVTWEAYMDNSC
ncbi:hypothetical protein BI308_05515 [Roseofilum reptotaenium AO1-A]|uniref:Uncharacterized protein n=1 Tax=Roseofilum reptotaenium AO1-A TaxID=1925591 RepID=A0A1L9QVA4_9CYAN|nr:hypothetical protein BI308_05515 [Roseofilum reptotaenium AO1-A]